MIATLPDQNMGVCLLRCCLFWAPSYSLSFVLGLVVAAMHCCCIALHGPLLASCARHDLTEIV